MDNRLKDFFKAEKWTNEFENHFAPGDLVSLEVAKSCVKAAFKAGWNADAEAREAQLAELVREFTKALNEINRQELNAQRPGGGYSTSATISYRTLKKARAKLTELNISTEEGK